MENENRREPEMKHLKTRVDWALQKKIRSLEDFVKALEKDRVAVVVRRGEQGRIYGITYIDYERKTVFNGGDLGKEYAAKGLLERLGVAMQQENADEKDHVKQKSASDKITISPASKHQDLLLTGDHKPNEYSVVKTTGKGLPGLIQEILQPDTNNESMNDELHKENEKRRRRRNQEREQ